jgi:hypothetical protein
VIADEGLIAYWSFDEGGGSVAHDYSGYGNDGTVSGANWVTGMCESALEFVYHDIVRYIPGYFDDPIGSAFSLEAWVRWYGEDPGTPARYCYILDGRTHVTTGLYWFIRPEGRVCLYQQTPGGIKSYCSRDSVRIGEWAHVALTFDYTSGEVHAFINGSPDTTHMAAAPYYDSYLSAAIGNNRWAPGDGQWATFNGIIDELRIYNRPLSPAEILDHYRDPCGQVAVEQVRWSAIKAMY